MKSTIWVFSLEPLETRYTGEWHKYFPQSLKVHFEDSYNVVQIDGEQKNSSTTPGAFLNFSDTNFWKNSQLCNFLELYNNGEVQNDDHFIFTDAWNPCIIQIKYMKELFKADWTLHGLWHAGSYDPADILGREIGDQQWIRSCELSIYDALDHNYFASEFHIDLFSKTFCPENRKPENWVISQMRFEKIVRTGWPMDYMECVLNQYTYQPKCDIILFPHRISPEKQIDIFYDLKNSLPEYEFIVCQEKQLSKDEYHKLLSKSKMVFSASLQETLGISVCAEGPIVDALPLAPNRLSYTEIFKDHTEFLYPSEWTTDYDSYLQHKDQLIDKIKFIMDNYEKLVPRNINYLNTTYKKYFYADELMRMIK